MNRFTRLVFGLTQSLFIFEETLKELFNNYKYVYPELIENTRNDMYVSDLVSGGNILSEVEVIKLKSKELFAKSGFNLPGNYIYEWMVRGNFKSPQNFKSIVFFIVSGLI